MALLTNLIVGTIVYGSMALLYAAIVIVPIVLVVGGLRLRSAASHGNHHLTLRPHRHGYQTH